MPGIAIQGEDIDEGSEIRVYVQHLINFFDQGLTRLRIQFERA